jgi:hypothetical protein
MLEVWSIFEIVKDSLAEVACCTIPSSSTIFDIGIEKENNVAVDKSYYESITVLGAVNDKPAHIECTYCSLLWLVDLPVSNLETVPIAVASEFGSSKLLQCIAFLGCQVLYSLH